MRTDSLDVKFDTRPLGQRLMISALTVWNRMACDMREVKAYMSVDLTQLSKANGGRFPRQAVYDAIDTRNSAPRADTQPCQPRFHFNISANLHFLSGLPIW